MPVTQISSRLKDWPKEKASVVVNYDLPTTLDELVAKFGSEVVAAKAVDSIVIDIQANVRRMAKKEGKDAMTQDQIQAKINDYKPSAQSAVRRPPAEKVADLVGKMSAEEKAELIRKLQSEATA